MNLGKKDEPMGLQDHDFNYLRKSLLCYGLEVKVKICTKLINKSKGQ